ncbi:MAG: hypothetical protein WCF93_03185 [Candidatus Moraniibacteriota bacterium]
MEKDLQKLARTWITTAPESVEVEDEFYCQSRDVFQARLDRMTNNLLKEFGTQAERIYIASAMAGEIGNNSFDHNLGSWTDVAGIFFGYDFFEDEIRIVLADRGRGVLATLRGVKPELENDADGLRTAFTERISGRAPESRGNGLKFVKENLQVRKMHLVFFSGNAQADLNEKMEIKEVAESVNGCLAILTL